MKKLIKGSELADKTLEVQDDGLLKIVSEEKFKPKGGEMFWFVSSFGNVSNRIYCAKDEEFIWLVNHHPVFKTEKDCEEYKHYLELLDKYTCEFSDMEWRDDSIEKCYMYYYNPSKTIEIGSYRLTKEFCYCFTSEEKAQEFIEAVGEQNVKRFMFNIWD